MNKSKLLVIATYQYTGDDRQTGAETNPILYFSTERAFIAVRENIPTERILFMNDPHCDKLTMLRSLERIIDAIDRLFIKHKTLFVILPLDFLPTFYNMIAGQNGGRLDVSTELVFDIEIERYPKEADFDRLRVFEVRAEENGAVLLQTKPATNPFLAPIERYRAEHSQKVEMESAVTADELIDIAQGNYSLFSEHRLRLIMNRLIGNEDYQRAGAVSDYLKNSQK